MTPFESTLLNELARVRKVFADHNIPHIELVIRASGPVDRDELKITFEVDGDYNHRAVVGDSLDATIAEFFRRNSWKKAHDYLALPNVRAPKED
jgi:hypothetical protein